MSKNQQHKSIAIYLLAAIAVLCCNSWQIVNSNGGLELVAIAPYSDAYLYHYSAWFKASISDNSFISKTLAFSPYETILASSIKLFGHSNLTPFVVNTLLAIVSCLLLMACSHKMFSLQAAVIAGFLYLLCDPILFFSGTTLKTNIVICLASLSLWLAILFFDTQQKRWLVLFCVTVFICAIDRIHILVLPIGLLITLWLTNTGLTVLKRAEASIICGICFFSMYGLSSLSYESEPEYLSPIGLNIYLGHSKPDNWNLWVEDIPNNLIGHREGAKKVAEKDLGKQLNNSQVTTYWLTRTLDYIKANPTQYLKAQSQKLIFLMSPSNYSIQEVYHHWRKRSVPLMFAFINFSILFPLFVIGMISARNTNRSKQVSGARNFTIVSGIIYLASLMTTIVIERYRVTAFVFMIPIASFALLQLSQLWKHKPAWIAAFLLMFLASITIGSFATNDLTDDRLARLELREKQRRLDRKEWFNLRSTIDQQKLSRDTCLAMQTALTNTNYHRDLKTLAIACKNAQ